MSRNDNDMYDHMNNSVYSFLYVVRSPWRPFPSPANCHAVFLNPNKVYQI